MTTEGERIGLCTHCRHARRVRSGKGAVFHLCELSRTDSRLPKYPNLPVRACAGFEAQDESAPGEGRAPG
jgi:hypothetical protein